MPWDDYEVIIETTDVHRIRVRAQSFENAEFRALKIFHEGPINEDYGLIPSYELIPSVDVHVRSREKL